MRLPDAEEVAWMKAHADDSIVTNIVACAIICGVASLIFVALRIASRLMARLPILMSDWLIVIAWVFFIVFDVSFGLTVLYGGGKHVIFVTDARMLQILNIVNENLYCFAMAFIKFSILSLYGTIFPQKAFRYCLWAVAAFMAMWAISAAVVAIFQCTPISYGWDPTLPGGHCVNYGLLVLIAGVFNIITDFVIFAMPIPLVRKLNLSKQKKMLVIFTFMIGGSACIISIIRLAFALAVGSTADGSWDNMPAGMLSVVELMVGILVASVPTYRPLYRRIFHGNADSSNDRSAGYRTRPTDPNFSRSVHISATGRGAHTAGGINIREDINMVTHSKKSGTWVRVSDDDEARLYKGSVQTSKSRDSFYT